ncbi:MAG: GspH/FimT family pseudopilin [Burkholderiaceae bacterium]|nr:GspH/FimT family pseudopilin [Burkholderiaceae bacterium]
MSFHPGPRRGCRGGAAQGLTMIELMVGLALMAILLVLAAPSFTDYLARRRLEGAANELSADLHYARSQAVGNNANTFLTTSATGYTVTGSVTVKNDGPPITFDTSVLTYKTITLTPGVSLTQPVTLEFEAQRGSLVLAAGATAPVTVTVSNTQTAAQLRLSVNALGRVYLCSPSGNFPGYVLCK